MKIIRLILLLLLFSTAVQASYLKARVETKDNEAMAGLFKMGLDIVYLQPGQYCDVFVSDQEYQMILANGFKAEVIIPDLEKHYSELRDGDNDFGPYYTYQEAMDRLDSLHTAFPQIVGQKINIGCSWEQREIWAIKVSDNPEINETEPAVLYSGVIHAREPIGASICIDLIRYLCQHYNEPEIKFIVDNCELWFTPILNPDGYVYNETYLGGLWRKNRRPEPGQVDLNRNFPFKWGYDNCGSSPNPVSEIYRGPNAASEPETQALIQFCQNHKFYATITYHSYGNDILFPFGYDLIMPADSLRFFEMAESLSLVNHYRYGTPWQILYLVNGSAEDWLYGTNKTLNFVFEVGEEFWQPDSQIIAKQFAENLYANLYLARQAILYGSGQTIPDEISLDIWPNPSKGFTVIQFGLDSNYDVKAAIYDLSGRRIKSLTQGYEPSGFRRFYWAGADDNGRKVSSGIYFCYLEIGKKKYQRKIVFIK